MGCTYGSSRLRHLVLGEIVAELVATVLLGLAIFAMYKIRSSKFDKTGFVSCLIAIILLWIVPWGLFVIVPIFILLSVVSPAARNEWAEHKKRRVSIILASIFLLSMFAFYPVTLPQGADEWGTPVATENTNSGIWPASEQYTWLYDGAAVSVLNIRTPHTMCAWSQDSSTITLGVFLGIHEKRMRQSIEVINSYIPGISVDPNSFSLVEIESEGTHTYEGNEFYITRFDVKRDGFDTTIATVLVVGFPDIGGELSVLTITRPITSAKNDVFEEKIVLQYID